MKEEKSLVTMVLYNIFFKQGMEKQVLNCAQMLAAYLSSKSCYYVVMGDHVVLLCCM